jgi:hypothetical protein
MSEEIQFRKFIKEIKLLFSYLIYKWRGILVAIILGAFIGIAVSYLKGKKYISRLTFVLEDSKSSSGAGLAAIAGQFGVDIGSLTGSSFFSGENIILYLTSDNLCRETLMTNYDSSGKMLLIDKYVEVSGLKSKWDKNKFTRGVSFSKFRNIDLPRREDSLIQIVVKKILKNDFIVSKPEKKASFIEVKTKMKDERLSNIFNKQLVEIATSRFIEFKTKVKFDNIVLLQKRADSLASLLNDKTYFVASSQQRIVDVNPALKAPPVLAEIATRDKVMLGTIFSEVVKNLEISKTLLQQSTPIVQIVDTSTFPLDREEFKLLPSILSGAIIIPILYCVGLVAFFLIRPEELKN